MKITILRKVGRYDQGETYDVRDSTAKTLIERGIAEAASSTPKKPTRKTGRQPDPTAGPGGGPPTEPIATVG